jgi:hypothetical protein
MESSQQTLNQIHELYKSLCKEHKLELMLHIRVDLEARATEEDSQIYVKAANMYLSYSQRCRSFRHCAQSMGVSVHRFRSYFDKGVVILIKKLYDCTDPLDYDKQVKKLYPFIRTHHIPAWEEIEKRRRCNLISVDQANLPVRIKNALSHIKIIYLQDLSAYTENEFMGTRAVGSVGMAAIRIEMDRHNVRFMDPAVATVMRS